MTDATALRDLLTRAGLTQRGFARAIGVSEREVRYWCADRPVPRWAMICARHLAECSHDRRASDNG